MGKSDKRTIFISQEQVFLLLALFYCLYGYSGGLKKICLRLGKRILVAIASETRFKFFVSPFFGDVCVHSLIHLSSSGSTIICFK